MGYYDMLMQNFARYCNSVGNFMLVYALLMMFIFLYLMQSFCVVCIIHCDANKLSLTNKLFIFSQTPIIVVKKKEVRMEKFH